MKKCLFCLIAKGKLPAKKIFENEKTISFLDKNPLTKGHCLVIPKKHYESIFDIDSENINSVIVAAQKTAKILKKKYGAQGINILHASGKTAQQSVFHFHIHILPRKQGDKIDAWPRH